MGGIWSLEQGRPGSVLGEQLEKRRSRDIYQKGLITCDVNLAFALALKNGAGVENQLYLVIKQE